MLGKTTGKWAIVSAIAMTLVLFGLLATACAQPTQEVVEKVKEVEKIVKETVVVEKEVEKRVVVTPTPPPLLERARQEGLRAGFVQENPFGFIDDEGNCTGFDIEVTREAAKRLGIEEIICVHLAWEGLIPGLLAGRIDMIPVGMAIKPERCEVVDFTDPYQAQGIAALVEKGNPKDIHSFQDFVEREDLKMGGTRGSSEIIIAREEFGIPEDRAVGYSEQVQAIDALRGGRVDAVMYTSLFINRYLQEQGTGELERAQPFESPSYFNSGHAFRPQDADFLQLWNDTLLEMKEDGTIEKLGTQWGWAPEDLLGPDAKVENCCRPGDDWQNFACTPE